MQDISQIAKRAQYAMREQQAKNTWTVFINESRAFFHPDWFKCDDCEDDDNDEDVLEWFYPDGDRTKDPIPAQPDLAYKDHGWLGWANWLGWQDLPATYKLTGVILPPEEE